MREISNWDYDRVFAGNRWYGGVFSKDKLPRLQEKFYFINLADDKDLGSHWTLIWNVGDRSIYFDSFGLSPPNQVLMRMDATGKDIVHNDEIIQALNSTNCGYYTIYVVQLLLAGHSFEEILSHFTEKRAQNEDWIEEWFKPLPNLYQSSRLKP